MYVLEDRIFRIDMQWFKLFNTETMFKIDLQDQGQPKPSSSSLVRLRSAVLWSWKRSPWPCNRTRVGQIDTYSSPSHRSNICIPTILMPTHPLLSCSPPRYWGTSRRYSQRTHSHGPYVTMVRGLSRPGHGWSSLKKYGKKGKQQCRCHKHK